jgi:Tol biopolymer transport system component
MVSPDGRSIAFVDTGGHERLYIRRLDRLEAAPVPGSEGVNSRPFWSADSRRLGFFAGGKLNTVSADGGDLQTLIDGLIGNGGSYSGAWSSAGAILFTQAGKPIYRIPETGGTATPVLSFNKSRGETAQLLSCFLPDGKHFLYTSTGQKGVDTYEGSLDGSKPVRVLSSAAVLGFSRPEHDRTGYLLYYSGGQILLKRVDPRSSRSSNNVILVRTAPSNCLLCSSTAGTFLATNTAGSIGGGTLAYVQDAASRQITWVSREGGTVEQAANRPSGQLADVRISPDQQHLLFARADAIWLAYAQGAGATRLTFNEGSASTPVFSPDGNRIAYTSEQSTIVIRTANGTGAPETVFKTSMEVHPASWSPSGEWLACIIGEPLHFDIDLIPVSPGRKPLTLVSEANMEAYQPQFSPDGRWIAYTSNESGTYQIYVVNVPSAAGGSAVPGRWQVSTAGGQQPRWRADGKELFFVSQEGEMMSVKINANAKGLRASTAEPLFSTGIIPVGPAYRYDVTADGRRFVLLKTVNGGAAPLKVIVNWSAAFGAQ